MDDMRNLGRRINACVALAACALVIGIIGIIAVGVDHARLGRAEATVKLLSSKLEALAVGPVRSVRGSWPALGQEKTIVLGEALKGTAKVTIFCPDASCVDLRDDLDDAFQIAGWESTFSSTVMLGDDDVGLLVGPPGEAANALGSALAIATGSSVMVIPMKVYGDLGIIIGKRPR